MTEHNKRYTIGWDVGGAHLKAALFNESRQLINVIQVPCALWQGLDLLEAAVTQVQQGLCPHHDTCGPLTHGVTMTGELVDLFDNRQIGVCEISRVMAAQLIGDVYFYKASAQITAPFIQHADVASGWSSLASVNWHASTTFVAQAIDHGLFIDMGSTTTDLIAFSDSKPQSQGLTDAERMQHNELVYTGMVRTPLMAVAQTITSPINSNAGTIANQETQVAAEYFATMADVYRLTGDLTAADDMSDTADGNDKTIVSSARRIARMIGYDVEQAEIASWVTLAEAFKAKQLEKIRHAMTMHLQRLSASKPDAKTIAVVGAGIGAPLIQQIVGRLPAVNNQTIVYHTLEATTPVVNIVAENTQLAQQASDYLPAVAVAYLLQQHINKND